jgi:phosphoribosylformylglycinamidine synthase PurS subunit
MKFLVQVMPRPEALDPQGRAVQGALFRLGFKVDDCRIGKSIVVELSENDSKDKAFALKQVTEMAEKILSNPLIEVFEVKAL